MTESKECTDLSLSYNRSGCKSKGKLCLRQPFLLQQMLNELSRDSGDDPDIQQLRDVWDTARLLSYEFDTIKKKESLPTDNGSVGEDTLTNN